MNGKEALRSISMIFYIGLRNMLGLEKATSVPKPSSPCSRA